jgi:hypothetical protein
VGTKLIGAIKEGIRRLSVSAAAAPPGNKVFSTARKLSVQSAVVKEGYLEKSGIAAFQSLQLRGWSTDFRRR